MPISKEESEEIVKLANEIAKNAATLASKVAGYEKS